MPKIFVDSTKGLYQKSANKQQSGIQYNSGLYGQVIPAFKAITTVSAATTLARNSLNRVTDTDTAVYALPAAADCVAGDVIVVEYDVNLANAGIHDYGTAGEFYSVASVVWKGIAGALHRHDLARANGTTHDFLKLTGATNGGVGVGTRLVFVFNGDNWTVECWARHSSAGSGAVAVTAAFATTSG